VVLPLAAIWSGLALVAQEFHMMLYPGQSLIGAKGLGPICAAVAPLFASIPIGMIVGNFLVRLLPAARRALDREAAEIPDGSYATAQRALWKLALILAPISIAVTGVGILLSW
jgi:hypothetical protein